MTLLYLITAIFTMLSIVLSVRRVPRAVPCCRPLPLPAPLPCSSITSLNNKGVPMLFRPAAESDLDAIERHYTELLTHEAETGRSTTNWSLGVYPTRQTAAAALAAGTLWVLEREGEPVASVILNHHQDDFYATIGWQYPAPPEQVLVVHTLCIPPRYAGQGLGRECVSRIKQQAAAMGCAVIRLDTWAGNIPAATLYQKNGFSLCGRAQVLFQGKIPEELVFLEYRCPPSADPPAVCGS